MPDASRALVSFNAGEFSPKLWSRLDQAKAGSACRLLENMIVETYGQARRRPGTRFVDFARSPAVKPKGPPGVTVTVNRHTDSEGHVITVFDCMKLSTWFEVRVLSITGSGCLCGFDEFVDLFHLPAIAKSHPPKKYRTWTQDGETYMYDSGVNCATDDGAGRLRDTYTGTIKYDARDCSITDATNKHEVSSGCYSSYDTNTPGTPSSSARIPVHVESTTVERFYGIGCNLGLCALGTLPNFADPSLIATVELSDEDKQTDALLRGVHTEGDSITAELTAFNESTYCFTSTAVLYIIELHGLVVGCGYHITVTHTRTDSMGAVTTVTEEIDFTADDTDPTIEQDIPTIVGGHTTLTSVELQQL